MIRKVYIHICTFIILSKHQKHEAMESVMCDVIKIRIKRRIATSGKGNQPLNIKTAVERPLLKLGKQILGGAFIYFTSRCIPHF